MASTTAGKLDFDDLSRYRLIHARDAAMSVAPSHWSRAEIEESMIRRYQLLESFVNKYGLDDSRSWQVSPYTGVIIYGEWE